MFALHPLRVESVAWISERQGLLCALFSILTLWAYVRYAARRQSRQRSAVVVLLFCLALMSKPTAISLPLVMLLLDRWPLDRFAAMPALALVREKIPLFAAAALSAGITVITNTGPIISLDSLPLRLRIATTASAYLGSLERFVWPGALSVRYPAEASSLTGIAAAGY